VIIAGRTAQFHESSDELALCGYRTSPSFVSHFQQEGLASFLIQNIGALHNLGHFERLLAERIQYVFSIIQQD
jgi:hypothetical protein